MDKMGWKELSSFQVGSVFCLPIIMVGYTLCQHYGLTNALMVLVIGNCLLYLLGIVSTKMSLEKRLTTADNALLYFGSAGVKCFAASLLVAKICWFGIQLNIMSLSVMPLIPIEINPLAINLLMGTLIISFATYGIGMLSRISMLCMPILLGTIGYLLCTLQSESIQLHPSSFQLEGVSVVIAAAITRVIDMPTFFRNAKNISDGLITTTILFALALPAIEAVGVYLSYYHSGESLMNTLVNGGGIYWKIWIAVFLLVTGWTTNNTNIYSGATCLQSLAKKLPEKFRTILVGTVGTGLALLGILNHFTLVLQIIGIMVGTMGSVILAGYVLTSTLRLRIPDRQFIRLNLMSWFSGVIIGMLALSKEINITYIPIVDSCLVAVLISVAGNLLLQRVKQTELI